MGCNQTDKTMWRDNFYALLVRAVTLPRYYGRTVCIAANLTHR